MKAFLQTYWSYMKAAVITMASAIIVFSITSAFHKGVISIPISENELLGAVMAVLAVLAGILVLLYDRRDNDIFSNTKFFVKPVFLTPSRCRLVKQATDVSIVVMFIDLRASTPRTRETQPEESSQQLVTFVNKLCGWILKGIAVTDVPSTAKFTGDGFMFVWEVRNSAIDEHTRAVVNLTSELTARYSSWVKSVEELNVCPSGIVVAVDFGCASRFTLENGSYDYLGSPVSVAVKMTELARSTGGVVLRDNGLLPKEIRSTFHEKDVVRLDNVEISVRIRRDSGESDIEVAGRSNQ